MFDYDQYLADQEVERGGIADPWIAQAAAHAFLHPDTPDVCDVCGEDEHTPEELAECIDSALYDPTDACPAGGPHTWGLLEEAGTGRTGWGCEECGTTQPERDQP